MRAIPRFSKSQVVRNQVPSSSTIMSSGNFSPSVKSEASFTDVARDARIWNSAAMGLTEAADADRLAAPPARRAAREPRGFAGASGASASAVATMASSLPGSNLVSANGLGSSRGGDDAAGDGSSWNDLLWMAEAVFMACFWW